MARGDVARLCRVGEGKTSSGRNSGSSAKRSSKYTSDSTLPDQHAHTQTQTQSTVYIHCPSIISAALHTTFTEVLTHLSTESKVFLSGGGRALTFLGVGPSLSVCGGGRAGSVADGGGRGEEGRDSFHPAYTESSIYILYATSQGCYERTTTSHYIRAESWGLLFLSPLWWLCFPCSVCQMGPLYWSPPGVCQRMAAH